jgi:xylulokinase
VSDVLVAGIDSSTQSTKVVLCRAEDGTVVAGAAAPHPDGTEIDPGHWWTALGTAGRELLERADAVAVAGQQHGMVALDRAGEVVRPALLWNDTRSAPQAARLVAELGGPGQWAARTGSVPVASFTVTKVRWLAEHEQTNAARTAAVLLPHDWLTWRLTTGTPLGGPRAPGRTAALEAATTDRGDASGTGYFSPATGEYLVDVAVAALGRDFIRPRVAAPNEIVGRTAWGAAVAPGTGDNMGAALGIGLDPGDVVVSIGTSGTAFAVRDVPSADPTGAVAGFADATGRFLPLVCTLNAARVLSTTARLIGASLAELSDLALAAEPGAGGITMLPYLDGERTPNRPDATGALRGLTTRNGTRENLARAAVEALLCSLADAVDALPGRPARILLIGGGARAEAVRRIAPGVFGVPVAVVGDAQTEAVGQTGDPGQAGDPEYVALGAARQAAWALSGTPLPPSWPRPGEREYTGEPAPLVRERYAALRDETS